MRRREREGNIERQRGERWRDGERGSEGARKREGGVRGREIETEEGIET